MESNGLKNHDRIYYVKSWTEEQRNHQDSL